MYGVKDQKGKFEKQSGAVLGQAQLKLEFDFTSIPKVSLYSAS